MNSLEILRDALNRGSVEALPEKPSIKNYNTLDYAIWRFLHAWRESSELNADHAVLMRQIIRWHEDDKFFVGTLPQIFKAFIEKAGIKLTHSGHLSAAPFAPAWLWSTLR